jgi:hypothetical protein
MFKKIFLALISITLMLCFILPLAVSAQENQQVNWPLKQSEVENLLDIIKEKPLTEANFDLFFESIEGYKPDSPRKTGAVVLVKQTILKKQLDYWFKDIPKELSIKFIKIAFNVIPLIYSQDISGVIGTIEKLSVEKATDYATNWLLQNEIKIGTGELNYSFYSYKGNRQEIKIQYIIVYHPLNQNQGEIVAEFYSKNPIEPPESKGSYGSPGNNTDWITSTCWPRDLWEEQERKGNNDGKLEPFIVRVKGYVRKDQWGKFDWDNSKKEPSVEIDFDNPVPEIENSDFILANPPSKISLTGETIKLFLEKLKSKTSEVTTNFLDIIKGYFSGSKSEAQIAEQIILEQIKEGKISPLSEPTSELTPELTEEEISEVEEILKETLEQGVSEEVSPTLEELKERLDGISERADILIAKIQKLLAERALNQPEEEPEEKTVICSLSDARYPAMNKVIFNEVAWMGTKNSSNDEWIELRNITGAKIDLNGWQILDKDVIEGKTSGIEIIFGKASINPSGFFLLERTDDSSVPNISADLIYTGSLNNTNEAIYLFDKSCNLQDKIEANPNWPTGDNSSKRTMERNPTNLGWQTSSNPEGTPKVKNSSGYYESPEEKTSKSSGGGTTSGQPKEEPKITLSYPQQNPANEDIEVNLNVSGLENIAYDVKISIETASGIISETLINEKENEWKSSTFYITNVFSGKSFNGSFKLRIKKEKQNFSGESEEADILVKIRENGKSKYFESIGKINIVKPANLSPVASFTFSPQNPFIGDLITFNAYNSTDTDGTILSYIWDFGDNASTTTAQATTTHTFNTLSQFHVILIVIDNQGATSTPTTTIIAISEPESYSPLDVVINEIAWMGTASSSNDEWIELYNNTNEKINLNNWTINWGEGTSTRSISLTGSILAYGFYLLERTASTTISDIEENQIYTGALKNTKISGGKYSGEKLELLSPSSEIIDIIDCSEEWFAGDNENKYTMERINPRLSGDNPANWANNDGITINGLDAGNNPIFGTPKAKNSVFLTSPPSSVPNFSLDEENSKYDTVVLTWSTTTDPDNPGQDISYIVYWAKEEISEENASATNPIASSTNTATTTFILSALDYNSTYYFGIRAFDGGNYSSLSTTTPYNTPLPPINDLNAGTSAIREAIDLFWTSNGAKNYIIKRAEKEIVENPTSTDKISWEEAYFVATSSAITAGEIETFTVENLESGKIYYFAIRTINAANAASEISNSPKAKAIPGFIDNDNGTITDLYTGLIWVKDGEGSGSNNSEPLVWQEAKDFSDNLVLCEDKTFISTSSTSTSLCTEHNGIKYDDWRLPNFKELASIIHYTTTTPTIDQNYFPNTTSTNYWTSSYIFHPATLCWAGGYCAYPASLDIEIVDFNNGSVGITSNKDTPYYIRSVRGPNPGMPNISSPTGIEGDSPKSCNSSYADNGDGTITDNCTGLVWVKGGTRVLIGEEDNYPLSPKPKTISWKEAIKLCNNLTTAGYNDWRLPNVRELINVSNINGSVILPWESGYSGYYWSSTLADDNAWVIGDGYNTGSVQILSKDGGVYIQCLRDNE